MVIGGLLVLIAGTVGLTVNFKVIEVQPDDEVAVIVATIGLSPVLSAVKGKILPIPLAGKPISGALLTQL